MSLAREYIKGDQTVGQEEAWESVCDLEHDRDKAWKLHAKAFARVKELEHDRFALREALEIAQADLETEGCNCGDASDLPCALCVVNNTLANYPKR